jgi:lycopene beta-cyclase
LKFDYIIAGSGCAGLSLAMQMVKCGKLSDKKILIVDKEQKDRNDRTWCFWEEGKNQFEEIVYKRWEKVWFYSDGVSKLLDLSPFEYKMIRGEDFYRHSLTELRHYSNVKFLTADVTEVNAKDSSITVNGDKLFGEYIFNSIPSKVDLDKKEFYLLQHFKGWLINTERPSFDPVAATLMDFRVEPEHGTTFSYVLPLSANKALVEYTLFSDQLLNESEYDLHLHEYISNQLGIDEYAIEEKEFGIIPMTNHKFKPAEGKVINIGSAGGLTKPSSGYTFYFIQKHSQAIVEALLNGADPSTVNSTTPKRFSFFDSVLLNVLSTGKAKGKEIFTDLFKSNSPQQILKFLNNESSILTDLKIISSLATFPFLKAGLQEI